MSSLPGPSLIHTGRFWGAWSHPLPQERVRQFLGTTGPRCCPRSAGAQSSTCRPPRRLPAGHSHHAAGPGGGATVALGHGGLVCFPLLPMPRFPQVWACWDLKSLSPRRRVWCQLPVTADRPPQGGSHARIRRVLSVWDGIGVWQPEARTHPSTTLQENRHRQETGVTSCRPLVTAA